MVLKAEQMLLRCCQSQFTEHCLWSNLFVKFTHWQTQNVSPESIPNKSQSLDWSNIITGSPPPMQFHYPGCHYCAFCLCLWWIFNVSRGPPAVPLIQIRVRRVPSVTCCNDTVTFWSVKKLCYPNSSNYVVSVFGLRLLELH